MDRDRRPNLLFVLVDEQKAGGLRVYGSRGHAMPKLEEFAAQGILFTSAFTPIPLCVPARASLFLGLYPHAHGLWTNRPRLAPSAPHLFSLLRDAGYTTALVGKNHLLRDEDVQDVFGHVFEADHAGYRTPTEPGYGEINEWLSRPELLTAPWGVATNPYPLERCPTHVLTNRALELLEELPEPFCIWLSYPDPHTPFQAPEPYASRYPSEEIDLPPTDDLATKPERQRVSRRMFAADKVTPEQVQRCIAAYFGMQDFIDDEFGRLIDALDASTLVERTVTVYTSDHGGYVGEHGLIRKSLAFYDCLLRIPLAIRWPDQIPDGVEHDGMVSHPDIAPTLLDLLRVERPRMQGRSIDLRRIESVRGAATVFAEAGIPGTPPTLSELTDVPEHPEDGRYAPWGGRTEAWLGPGAMVRTHQRKLVRYASGETEAYDLRADPHELTNLQEDGDGPDALDGHLASRLISARDTTTGDYGTTRE